MSRNESVASATSRAVSLVNFPFLTKEALAAISKKYDLRMSIFELRFCQQYYRSIKRDPRMEELILLDSIVKEGYQKADSYLLSEMKTESDVIADTFADLMTRRSATQRAEKKPLSLSALAGLMETWINANDPDGQPASDVSIRFSRYRDLLLAADGYQRTASSGNEDDDISIGVRARRHTNDKTVPADGDYVYAILSREENDLPFLHTLAGFLSSSAVSNSVKLIKIAQNRSLLPLLAEINCGMTVHTETIAEAEGTWLTSLTVPVSGAVFIASPKVSTDMLLEAQENGLRVHLLAKVNATDTVRIKTEGKDISFPTEFLRSMTFSRLYSATVDDPKTGDVSVSLSRIGTCTLNGKRNAVVKVNATGSSPFRAALLGVICSLSHCVAAGADVTEVKLTAKLSLSANRTGENLGAILGLYRTQAEFALRGSAPTVSIEKDAHPSLCAVTLAPLPNTTLSATASGNGTKIFYLEPLYTSDGIPDFDDLKKMYGYLGKLIADGRILAIRPTGEALLTDLEEMSRDVVVEYVPDSPVPSHIGGFLVETKDDIEGILIAKTEKPDKSETDS